MSIVVFRGVGGYHRIGGLLVTNYKTIQCHSPEDKINFSVCPSQNYHGVNRTFHSGVKMDGA
jgi:hypothetical protein